MRMKLLPKRTGTSSSGRPFHREEETPVEKDAERGGEDRQSGCGASGTGDRAKSGVTTKQIKFESNVDGWHRCTLYTSPFYLFVLR